MKLSGKLSNRDLKEWWKYKYGIIFSKFSKKINSLIDDTSIAIVFH